MGAPPPTLLDALPLLTAGTLAGAPPRLLAQLYQALDLQFLYNKEDNQVTIRAILTDTTPGDLATLITTLRDDNPATGNPAPTTESSQRQTQESPAVRFQPNALSPAQVFLIMGLAGLASEREDAHADRSCRERGCGRGSDRTANVIGLPATRDLHR